MAYLTISDVLDELSDLKTLNDAGKVSDDQIEAWIDSADAIIDSKCGQKYAVPFAVGEVPPLIVTIAKWIVGFLWLESSQAPPKGEWDWIKPRYTRAMQFLENIATGKEFLFLADGTAIEQVPAKTRLPAGNNKNITPVFGMEDFWNRDDIDEDYP